MSKTDDAFSGKLLFDAGWRTGSAISEIGLARIKELLTEATDPRACSFLSITDSRIFVVSQSCDLCAFDLNTEPFAECIVGTAYPKLQRQNTILRTLRTLSIETQDSKFFDLKMERRFWIPRDWLAEVKPDVSLSITLAGVKLMQKWLARRYGRTAFPNELVNRLGFNAKNSSIKYLLEAINKFTFQIRIGVVPLDVELPLDQDYKIRVLAIQNDGLELPDDIRSKFADFESGLRTLKGIDVVEFRREFASSVTVADLRENEEWHLEDLTMSLSSEDPDADGIGRV